MKKSIKWGILGPGKIAKKVARDIQLSENGELYAVASRELKRAQHFSKTFNVPVFYGSYIELLKDENIDVVYIATPHTFHFEHTMLALNHRKHVLCEKPLAMNIQQVEIMVKEARSRRLFLMEGIWTRFIPATEKLIQLLDDRLIGDVISIRADFGFKSSMDLKGRLFEKKLGGGSLLDIGIYPVYLSLLILGVPNEIMAMARMTKTGVDSFTSIMFNYSNQAKASLESTLEAHTPIEALIYGTKGKIRLASRFHHSERLEVFENEGVKEQFDLKYLGNGYVHEINEVNQCLFNQKVESSKLPLSMSMQLISTLDKVRAKIGLRYDLED